MKEFIEHMQALLIGAQFMIIFLYTREYFRWTKDQERLRDERKQALELIEYYGKLVRHVQSTKPTKRLIPINTKESE